MSRLLSFRTGLWRVVKSGSSLFLLLLLTKYLVVMIWCGLNKISFFPNQIMNALANIAVLTTILCFLGYLNLSKWFQYLKNNSLAYLPLIGQVVKVYNQFEKIKDNALEVSVEIADGVYVLGWISREWKNEKGVGMCEVQVPAHISPMGLPLTVRKDRALLTGRKAIKTVVFALSGGIAGDPPMKL